MAVKGKSKADILAAFRTRLANDADAETNTALGEIDRIAALRLRIFCLERFRSHHSRPRPVVRRRSGGERLARLFAHRGRSRAGRGRSHRGGRRSARHPRARPRRGRRRSSGLPHSSGLHRRAHPLSADPGDRLLRRAAPRLAAKLHLRRRAEICRSRALRARSPSSFSTNCFARAPRPPWSIVPCIQVRPRPSSPQPKRAMRA